MCAINLKVMAKTKVIVKKQAEKIKWNVLKSALYVFAIAILKV